jgi:hypothetical protein
VKSKKTAAAAKREKKKETGALTHLVYSKDRERVEKDDWLTTNKERSSRRQEFKKNSLAVYRQKKKRLIMRRYSNTQGASVSILNKINK